MGMVQHRLASRYDRSGSPHACGDGPISCPLVSVTLSSPHACGDGPKPPGERHHRGAFSPRVWGWSVGEWVGQLCGDVLPTRVGMVQSPPVSGITEGRSPHACGDGPHGDGIWWCRALFSPRVWGWSSISRDRRRSGRVLPTRVGMVRRDEILNIVQASSPHACGDGPASANASRHIAAFSPRV